MSSISDFLVTLASNGYVDSGIAFASDAGLSRDKYLKIPMCCIKASTITYVDDSQDSFAPPGMDAYGRSDGDFIFETIESKVSGEYDPTDAQLRITKGDVDLVIKDYTIDSLTEADMVSLYVANRGTYDPALGMDTYAELYTIVRVMSYVLGYVGVGMSGEYEIVADPVIGQDEFKRANEAFQTHKDFAVMLCAATAINHYKLNHATGAPTTAYAVRKVCNMIGIQWERGRDPIAVARNRQIDTFVYQMVHFVCKRNAGWAVLGADRFILRKFNIGMPAPVSQAIDDFLRMRAVGVAASNAKIGVVYATIKRIAAANLLAFMPGIEHLEELGNRYHLAVEVGARAHVGARWYAESSSIPPVDVSQSDDMVVDLLVATGIFNQIMNPHSTLSMSPAYTRVLEDNPDAFPDWQAICHAFKKSLKSDKSSILVKGVLDKISFSKEIDQMADDYSAADLANDDAAREAVLSDFKTYNRDLAKKMDLRSGL